MRSVGMSVCCSNARSTTPGIPDIAARADADEGIRQGLEQAKRGEGRDVEEFFAGFEAKHGISG